MVESPPKSHNGSMRPLVLTSLCWRRVNQVRPLWVRLLDDHKPLSADNKYELSCEVVGARPQPIITWWKASVPLRNTREIVTSDRNVTTSVLTFTPMLDDSGKILTCRAEVPLIPNSMLEDGWKLNVQHVPIVSLELGSNLDPNEIREGVDVYFECNIKSNPWVYNVSWRHMGHLLTNNVTAGMIVSNQSLVLQAVTRVRAGYYTCVGSNIEGDGESTINLDVKYAPVCKSNQQTVYGVARQEAARIQCELDANPTDVTFFWKFNNTSETADLPVSHVATDRARSIATYMPMTELDYGSLLCWGKNSVGSQTQPCVFQIIPAGKPDALRNCTIVNQTANSLHVECTEGFDGGLAQEFVMEVYDAVSQNLVSNVTMKTASFTVSGLRSGFGFDVSLYAANAKGQSDPVSLQAATLKAAAKRTGTSWASADRPAPPAHCHIIHQTINSINISCHSSSNIATYVVQAYDAETRRLLASGTSIDPRNIGITDVPRSYVGSSGLLLAIQAVTPRASSEAVYIYTEPLNGITQKHRAAVTPAMLEMTPLLGILIGVVAALILVAVVVVVVVRMRGSGSRRGSSSHIDEKDRTDDGGMLAHSLAGSIGNAHIRGGAITAALCEKNVSKDTESETLDSLDEKNPDIIPQNSDTDYVDREEKAFVKLNNVPPRLYVSPPVRPTAYDNPTATNTLPKLKEEVTYAELSHAKPVSAAAAALLQSYGTAPRRTVEPTVYAQIDVAKMGTMPTESSALPLLHHHHALAAAYHHHPGNPTVMPTTRLPHTSSPTAQLADDEHSTTAETPLIPPHREGTMGLHPIAETCRVVTGGPTARVTTTRF